MRKITKSSSRLRRGLLAAAIGASGFTAVGTAAIAVAPGVASASIGQCFAISLNATCAWSEPNFQDPDNTSPGEVMDSFNTAVPNWMSIPATPGACAPAWIYASWYQCAESLANYFMQAPAAYFYTGTYFQGHEIQVLYNATKSNLGIYNETIESSRYSNP